MHYIEAVKKLRKLAQTDAFDVSSADDRKKEKEEKECDCDCDCCSKKKASSSSNLTKVASKYSKALYKKGSSDDFKHAFLQYEEIGEAMYDLIQGLVDYVDEGAAEDPEYGQVAREYVHVISPAIKSIIDKVKEIDAKIEAGPQATELTRDSEGAEITSIFKNQ